ncbi:MAG: hypothetical protein MRZ63_01855 [Anaerostipes sp.]|nr:hypothetical protein [Anaerostipes sp.]
MSENEIILVSNQATELPNLIHVFSCSTSGQTKILSLVQGQMGRSLLKNHLQMGGI